ncbi:sigma-70 family RNA polymerase sigma factor [Planctomicrobium sp. SH668]|uniref:sigma-70 family RNA polymerase sigma factor n=1 Tax=Planctomicrobium sp. SH668 TaxID=3448126 RepID=UPI003F5CB9D4
MMMPTDDSRIIELTLAGNRDAFGELVLKYQDRLFGTLVHLLGSTHDARDVGQDAFLLAYRKLKTFRNESSFYSWLFRIAYHAAISNRRKRKGPLHSLDEQKERTGIEPVHLNASSSPDHGLISVETQQQVRDALDSIGVEYRDAIVLKEIEGLKYEEIAEIQDCPIGTVRSRIHRARILLKQHLTRVAEREQN